MSVGVIIFSIVLGAAALYAYTKVKSDNKTVETWSKTKGTILKSEVIGRHVSSLRLQVDYEYFIDGVRYESNNVYRKNPRYDLGHPYDLDKLEFLKNPEVKYDPQNPSDCCLLTYDNPWYLVLLLLFGVILSLVGWIGLLAKVF